MLEAVSSDPSSKTNGPVTSAPNAVVEKRLRLPATLGAPDVSKPALAFLTRDEYPDYLGGEQIFSLPNRTTMRVKVKPESTKWVTSYDVLREARSSDTHGLVIQSIKIVLFLRNTY